MAPPRQTPLRALLAPLRPPPEPAPMSMGEAYSEAPDVGPLMSQAPPAPAMPSVLAMPPQRAPVDLTGTTLGDGGGYQPTPIDPLLAEFGGHAPAPGSLAGMPRFLAAPGAQAPAAPVAPGPTAPAGSPVPFLRALETGRDVGAVTREMTPRARPEAGRALPRLVGGPRRRDIHEAPPAPELDSMGRSLAPDFVDAMTQRQQPIWQEPRETSYDRERRAIDVARQLEQQRSEMIARQAADAADAEAAFAQRQNEHEAARARAEGDARAAMARSADRLAGMRIDPSRFYRNADVGGMIGNAIAIGLGAMGEALGGGPNRALEMVQQAIDRDLSAQERDIQTAGQDVESRRGILAEVRNDYRSREAALEAARAIALREAAARAEAEAAQAGSAAAQANAIVLRDQLLTRYEEAQANALHAEATGLLSMRQTLANIRRTEARASQEETRAARMAGAGSGPRPPSPITGAQMTAFDAITSSSPETPREEAARLAGLPPGFVPSGNPITIEARRVLDAQDSMLRQVEGLIDAAGEGDIEGVGYGTELIPDALRSDVALRLRSALESLVDLEVRSRSGANAPEGERDRIMGEIVGDGSERALRIGIESMRRRLDAQLGRGGARGSGAAVADRAVAATGVREVVE